MIRLADARLAASIMIHCSRSESLTERPGRAAVGLDDEHVRAPHRLGEARPHLAVGEVDQVGVADRDPRLAAMSVGQGRMGAAGQQVQLAGGGQLHKPSGHRSTFMTCVMAALGHLAHQ